MGYYKFAVNLDECCPVPVNGSFTTLLAIRRLMICSISDTLDEQGIQCKTIARGSITLLRNVLSLKPIHSKRSNAYPVDDKRGTGRYS